MDILVLLHSLVRWVLVAVALVALGKLAAGLARNAAAPDNMDRGLMSGFSGLVDLQVLLGVILVISLALTSGDLARFIPHIGVMVLAAITAHLPMRWRQRKDAHVLRNNLLVIVGVLVLVFIGVLLLPRGLSLWTSIS